MGIRNIVSNFGRWFKYAICFPFSFWFRHVVDIGCHFLLIVEY
jgi:hypothetical protein